MLLTCAPLEHLAEGRVDLEKWDAMIPDIERPEIINPKTQEIVRPKQTLPRIHETAHLYKDLIDSGFDPNSPEAYCAKLKQDKALPECQPRMIGSMVSSAPVR